MVGTDHCLEVLVIPVASAREGGWGVGGREEIGLGNFLRAAVGSPCSESQALAQGAWEAAILMPPSVWFWLQHLLALWPSLAHGFLVCKTMSWVRGFL